MALRLLHLSAVSLLVASCTSRPEITRETDVTASATPPALTPCSGERLEYGVALAGLPIGSAALSARNSADGWCFALEGGTNALVDWFCAVRGAATTRQRSDGSARSFELWVDEDGSRSSRSLAYDEVPTLWYRPADDTSWVSELTQYRRPNDPLSLLQELRALAPTEAARDFEVAMTLRSFCYRVRYLGRADLAVGAGDFAQALMWRVEVRPYEELGETAVPGPVVGFYEVAISSDARRLPLRVTREFGFGQVALELRHAGIDDTEALASGPIAPIAAPLATALLEK